MLVLLLCAVLGEIFQPGVISQAHASLLSQNDRTYKDAPVNFQGQLLMTIFRIGTIAMGLYLCLYTGGQSGFGVFAALCGLVIALILVKMLCNNLLDYTFQISRRFMPPYEQYSDITTITTYLLYPALLVMLRVDNLVLNRWLVGVVAALFLLMWLYRLARNYVHSFAGLAYVVLYIATLEILPLGILFYLGLKTISII
jgi:hypothetical protein